VKTERDWYLKRAGTLIALYEAKGPDMRTASHAFIASAAVICAVSAASPANAAGDPAAGERAFALCAACHSTTAGERKIGPSLAGVFGRKSGSETGYSYSPALKAANITWDEHTLDQFLANPGADVHGTKMLVSVSNATDRQNIISYLQTLK
jgi:cytochrome c